MAGTVERFFEETVFPYDVSKEYSASNKPWYALIKAMAPVIAEKCGFTIVDDKATTNGYVTFSIPNFPGRLRITAPSGTSDVQWFTVDLRNSADDTSLHQAEHRLVYHTGTRGNITIGFSHIGDFLYWFYLGPTDYPNPKNYDWVGLFWGWFNGTYTKEKYYVYFTYYQENASKNTILKYLTDPTKFKDITVEDISKISSKATLYNYAQPAANYPSDPAVTQLRPYMQSCASGDATFPNPGLCKWGGKYMLYVLTPNGSETPIETQPEIEYKINGKKYLGCAARLIIPEPWPFKEESEIWPT